MLIAPNSEVRFLDVPWDATYENTMYFENRAAQTAYMMSRGRGTLSENSYMRKGKGWIRVGWSIETPESIKPIQWLYDVSYMMFKNTSYENKWWYAFIDKVEYVNDCTIDVFYTIDVIQSYLFDVQFNECCIERMHTRTDNFGENTIPENVETGEYVCSRDFKYTYNPCVCVVTSTDETGEYSPGTFIPGMKDYFSGFQFKTFAITAEKLLELNDYLESFTARPEGVVAIFMCPVNWVREDGASAAEPVNYTFSVTLQDGTYCLGYGDGTPNGYTPRNKKLCTYPFNMLYLSNLQSSYLPLRFEFFSDPTNCKVSIWGNCSTNPGLIAWAKDYKGLSDNYDEYVELSGFPLCAWTYDTFKAWLAQNAGTLIAMGSKTAMDIGFAMAANEPEVASDAVQGGLYRTVDVLGQMINHAIKAPTAQGSSNGNLLYQSGLLTFFITKKHIRPEYARIIDKFFDMYGYAVNTLGYPQIMNRPCYSYIKTAGCSVNGNLTSEDSRQIEQIYDKGIRFWRTTAVFGSYDPAVNNNSPEVTP